MGSQDAQKPVAWRYRFNDDVARVGDTPWTYTDRDPAEWRNPSIEAEPLYATQMANELALSNAFWRMFRHGVDGNRVSAQCEVQALGMFLRGVDIPAWRLPTIHQDQSANGRAA